MNPVHSDYSWPDTNPTRKRGPGNDFPSLARFEDALFLPTTRLARVEACLDNQNPAFFLPTLCHGGACLRRALFRTKHRSTGASPAGAKKRVLRGFLVFKHDSTGASPVVVDEKRNFKRASEGPWLVTSAPSLARQACVPNTKT